MSKRKEEISLDEVKKIQLEMLIEIDKFCREHNIKYMLAFGSLLGAIRHKGYIPWDDDVDISMPLEDMLRFKKEFKSEKLEYIDSYTDRYFFFSFSRIAHKSTYGSCGILSKTHGVCIDLYPTLEVSDSKCVNRKKVDGLLPYYKFRNFVTKWRGRVLRYLPIPNIPFVQYIAQRYAQRMINVFGKSNGGAYHCIAGPLEAFDAHTFYFNPFAEMIEVEFEGYKFMAPAKYHEYLSAHYGDYMQLPPEDQRHPYHSGSFYWK